MVKRKLTISLCFVLLTFLLLPLNTAAQENVNIGQEKKFYIFLQGAFSMVSDMGSETDYIAGENDFPVTPAHSEFGGGIGFYFAISDNIGLQFSGEYLLGAEVTKEDPSDGETYNYKTYDNVNALGSLVVSFGDETQFFVTGGAGVNILLPYEDKEETGSLGSIIIIQAPETTTNILVAFGGGVLFKLDAVAVKIDAQYAMVLDYDKNFIYLRVGFGF